MFTNATLLALYAHARRDEDLRHGLAAIGGGAGRPATSLLRRLLPPRPPTAAIALQPR
jgi:hypothetical protein